MTNALIGGAVALSVILQAGSAKQPVPQRKLGELSSKALAAAAVQIEKLDRAVARQTGPRLERGSCNMPVVLGDASVDPKSIVPIERGKADHKIRTIEPTVCWEKEPGRR